MTSTHDQNHCLILTEQTLPLEALNQTIFSNMEKECFRNDIAESIRQRKSLHCQNQSQSKLKNESVK